MIKFIKHIINPSNRGITRWKSLYNNTHPGRRIPSLATSIYLVTICIFSGLPEKNTPIQAFFYTGGKQSINANVNLTKKISTQEESLLHKSNRRTLNQKLNQQAIVTKFSSVSRKTDLSTEPSQSYNNVYSINLSNPDISAEKLNVKSGQITRVNNRIFLGRKDKNLHFELYTTPSLTGSGMMGAILHVKNNQMSNSFPLGDGNENQSFRLYKSWEVEAGGSVLLDVSSTIRLKAGMQLNFANYVMEKEGGLPKNSNSDLTDASLLNRTSENITSINGSTYRLSIPIGTELKLAGNGLIDWFAGATLQPSLLLSHQDIKPNEEISAEGIPNAAFRKWNFASTFETFLNYRITGHASLKLGPQVRYQFMPSLIPAYNVPERLCQLGLKIGITGNF